MSYVMTAEHKAKLSATKMGHVVAQSTRELLRRANVGRHPSIETRTKMTAAHLGLKPSLGCYPSEETKRKMSTAHLGHHLSDEGKAKVSAAKLGHHMSDETKAKDAAVHLGLKASPETRAKLCAIHKDQRGPLNPYWKGGISPENDRIRNSPEYAVWRTAVFERDHFTCQDCGDNTGGNLEAHHMKPFATYRELRFVVDNGKTLCLKCHKAKRPRVEA